MRFRVGTDMEYKKAKRMAALGIFLGSFLLLYSFISAVSTFYFLLNFWADKTVSASQTEIFDPYSGASKADTVQLFSAQGLSYAFAGENGKEKEYYLAFSGNGSICIVKMWDDLSEECEALIAYAFGEEDGIPPQMVEFRGISKPMKEDIWEYGLSAMRILVDAEEMTAEEFENYVGTYYLDMTEVPGQRREGEVIWSFAVGFAMFFFWGMVILVNSIWKRNNAIMAMERAHRGLEMGWEYQNAEGEDSEESNL